MCNFECLKITMIGNISNLMIQIYSIYDPVKGSNQRLVNIVYSVFTIIAFIILGLSLRKSYGVKYSYGATIIIILRQSFRLLDFEDTKDKMDPIDWNYLVVMQTGISFSIIVVNTFMFNNVKYNRIIMFVLHLYCISCAAYTCLGNSNLKKNHLIVKFIPVELACLFYLYQTGKNIPFVLDLIVKKS